MAILEPVTPQECADWAHAYYVRTRPDALPFSQLLAAGELCAQITAEHLNTGGIARAKVFAQAFQLLKEQRDHLQSTRQVAA